MGKMPKRYIKVIAGSVLPVIVLPTLKGMPVPPRALSIPVSHLLSRGGFSFRDHASDNVLIAAAVIWFGPWFTKGSDKSGEVVAILIVHSNPDSLRSLSTMLSEHDYDTLLADSTKMAVTYLQGRSSIDVLLTDFELADGTALELLKFVNDNLRFRHVSVVICSEHSDLYAVRTSIQRGAKGFIRLPVSPDVLLDRIQQALESTRKNVMIVETNHVLADILKRMMERDGYDAYTASSAGDALEVLKAKNVDLIIMEPLIDDMSPWDMLVAIKEIRPRSKVLFLLDRETSVNSEDMIARGIDGVVMKPFISIVIRNKVREVLSGI